jgi:DNA-binding transcriptional ArsR family regulator
VTGTNDLGDHQLAAVLGSQHYGDDAIERFCALAGREVDTSRDGGRGGALGYDDDLAEAYLKHMSDDQTMQAILRFARGDSGATVVARTSALREDLPVVGRAQVVDTWSDTATTIAREYRRLGDEFTAGDVADSVDVSRRQVRRVLAELVEAGYIRHVGGGAGVAKVYEPSSDPGAGEVDLPERGDAVAADGQPGPTATNQYYTWNVRVRGGEQDSAQQHTPIEVRHRGAPPSPTAVDGVEPPD